MTYLPLTGAVYTFAPVAALILTTLAVGKVVFACTLLLVLVVGFLGACVVDFLSVYCSGTH
ncbi:Uncharacterised protein [Chlamydia trachomatis]|nr:Uncharacterised protein [Chlamydia trachomatis]